MDAEQLTEEIHKLIKIGIAEDIRSGDITSEACIPEDEPLSCKLILKQWGRLAGLPFLAQIFQTIDPTIQVDLYLEEGTIAKAGTVIGRVNGPARGIITAERVALNFLRHASGIATITTIYKEKLTDYGCEHIDLLDTRKTLPGLRALDRYAVRIGGGKNHRDGLDDRFVIKGSHQKFIALHERRPIIEAVRKARAYRPNVRVEVEVSRISQVEEALEAAPDIIMLDNMPVFNVEKAVKLIRASNKNIYIEACGGIFLDTIGAYAETGVDGISIAALTDSVENLDITLRF